MAAQNRGSLAQDFLCPARREFDARSSHPWRARRTARARQERRHITSANIHETIPPLAGMRKPDISSAGYT